MPPKKPVLNFKSKLTEPSEQFLDGLLSRAYDFAQHLDNQTSILVGVSSAIFVFSLSLVVEQQGSFPFLILGIFAGCAALVGLFAVHPPKFMRKRGQEESLMYNKSIAGFASSSEYGEALEKIVDDKRAVIHEYAKEIYNVSKFYYRPKRKLFHLSRNILLIGIIVSLFVFLLSVLLM
ncbi:MAG: hypothetical protein A3E07_01765 [Candidatus Wildermuthbacteria bacterium RIFCSPHIGHO2_12_FULL_45_9]|uniref:Pycsar effector protein domain-containing protein n=1 Tax=Candidatus Wildermuthbacteria bacterium RIFCSPHIGHO2_02_FULL_45_25 TaxID=1802450 RepID=A0A1G2R5Q3_9BACT|nr:MAG: hypothetical protein A2748_03280 [Candidatus Wildermuthbacteria bacterium RIFCSPHIGHO2_01_FULL_45_20]OHA67421.1 MAG: hypothetical protein A3C04_03500 [Candidatus Wildermuthbacteria bacterium RIFCSPHIGHO2_02_FULL_45_25]OHA71495.1 MAG: hypothetical protein A3E07_01765 [Candidatus Wildermuthbacteria bacterium RIFCSPHIGHO2_12_FULL_45_9]